MSLNFVVRLEDMEAVERRYRAADSEGRLAFHQALEFYALLTPVERAAIERRFPGELDLDPEAPGDADAEAILAARIAWDFRCRELVLAMLGFADEVLAGKLDLGSRLAADEARTALALTATGSILEVRRPDALGRRAYVYRPSARPDAQVRLGQAALQSGLRLGDRARIGDLVTSEILVLATGDGLPETPAPPRFAMFGDADQPLGDARGAPSQLDAIRFRVLTDALNSLAETDEIPAAEARLEALASHIQTACGGATHGYPLARLDAFATGWGLTYSVERGPNERFILIGTNAANPERRIVLPNVDIGAQRVVVGAPLVMRFGADAKLAIIPRIAAVEPSASPSSETGG